VCVRVCVCVHLRGSISQVMTLGPPLCVQCVSVCVCECERVCLLCVCVCVQLRGSMSLVLTQGPPVCVQCVRVCVCDCE